MSSFIKTFACLALLALLCVPAASAAVSITPGTDQYGNNCDIVSWTDSKGKPRTLWLVKDTPGAYVSRYTWYRGATLVDARPRENLPFTFLVLVNHWHPESTGDFVTSAGLSSAGTTSYLQNVVASVPFSGPGHLVWQGTLKMKIDPADATTGFFITIQYFFAEGRDDFTWSVAYDAAEKPEAQMWSDNRSPYGDFDWDGDGTANEELSGTGYGSLYKFKTLGSTLTSASAWDNTQPNTIPYVWQWKDTAKNDAELAIVQNQPYADQNGSMEVHVGSCSGFPAPPTTGTSMPSSISCYGYQMNSYAAWQGQRFTWGTQYRNPWGIFGNGKGVFENGHNDAFNAYTYNNAYPVNAWSMNILIDRWSDNGQAALVTDTENIYASTLNANVGAVKTTGPRGPGNNMSASTGTMPTITYSNPGFDFVYRAWRADAVGGTVDLNLSVSGGLVRPTFMIDNLASPACDIRLDGISQVEGVDVAVSHDAAGQRLYVTFLKDLSAGVRNLKVLSSCGTPTATATPCTNCSATPSTTSTPVYTATVSPSPSPSFTPVPPCPNGLVDTMEDNNITNDFGGSWATWVGGGTVLPAPFAMSAPGYLSSFSAGVNGNNVASNVSTLSAFLNSSNGVVPKDLSAFDGIGFWILGNGGSYRMQIFLDDGSWNTYGLVITPPAGVWTQYKIAFSDLVLGWAGPEVWDPTLALQVTFYPTLDGAYDYRVDALEFYCNGVTPTSTPTILPGSPTSTKTPSQTPTQTASATSSPTVSSTPTVTFSVTSSETFTGSPTETITQTQTPSPTLSPSFTASETFTQSPSETATQSRTPSPSLSPSFTVSQTPSRTAVNTNTPSATVSFSQTKTSTLTQTLVPSASKSASPSATRTNVPGIATSTQTLSPTPSLSATATQTALFSASASSVPSSGINRIVRAVAAPNPNPASIHLQLQSRVDTVTIELYTAAMQQVRQLDFNGSFGPGWEAFNTAGALQGLSNGVYYFKVRSWRNGAAGEDKLPGRLFILR